MQDFRRDWQSWTVAERVTATGIFAFIMLFVPAAIALMSHPY